MQTNNNGAGGDEVIRLLQEIRDRVAKLEEGMTVAFPKNDLGRPDWDGHRMDHVYRMEQAKELRGYKIEATKKILVVGVAAIVALLASGFADFVKNLVKGVAP